MSGARSELARFGLRRVDVADHVGDVVFPDPYRQLEDETCAVQAWQAYRHAEAGAALGAIPGLDALAAQVAAHLTADLLVAPLPAGGRWFAPERAVDGTIRRVRVVERPQQRDGRVVVDAADVVVDGGEAIDWLVPSPDGRLLALGVSSHGDEQAVLALVDVEDGALVGAPVRHVAGVAWLPDASGLYLARGAAPAQELPLKRLAFLAPGGRPEWVAAPPDAAAASARVQVSADGRHVGFASDLGSPRLLYVHDRLDGSWSPVLPSDEGDEICFGTFRDDAYVAVTDVGGSGRARLVAAPLARIGERASWRELLNGVDAVLRGVATVGELLLVCELADGVPRLRLLDGEGVERARVPLPLGLTIGSHDRLRNVSAAGVPAQHAGGELVFTASASDRPATLWRYDVAAGRLDELTAPAPAAVPVRSETLLCTAPDGRDVPCELIRRADLPAGALAPVLLHGYGGYNEAPLPRGYPGAFMPWIEAGGVYAYAHLRGDGTFGTAQWRGGRRGEKQRTVDDLLAVAQTLLSRGLTTSAQLALWGASNGGLLVGAAITQRPELFAAAAILTPIADMARLDREHYPEAFRREYGDVRIAEQARWMRGYSPYHRVEAGTAYPATIVVAGDRDLRTHAWHARKLAAALLDASDPATPVLLRVHRDHGHLDTALADPKLIAEWLAFLMQRVGLRVSEFDRPSGSGHQT